jgi:hypothetical protein
MRGMKSLVCVFLTACGAGPSDRPGGDDDPTPGVDASGTSGDGCSEESKLVYVVDENNTLSQFNPPMRTFTDLGKLMCPALFGATPFSMAVDRTAVAWVLYSSGELFRVDTKAALACTKSAWQPNTGGNAVFGMGFSTDAAGGTADTLFIAGGAGPTVPTSKLAKLDLATFQPAAVGNVTGWPELTGTGSAELWGFFPAATGTHISRLEKTNGTTPTNYALPTMDGEARAWAFAFHGGSFYVFLRKMTEGATNVYQINSATGAIMQTTPAAGRTIVGAGVSTCAPVIL